MWFFNKLFCVLKLNTPSDDAEKTKAKINISGLNSAKNKKVGSKKKHKISFYSDTFWKRVTVKGIIKEFHNKKDINKYNYNGQTYLMKAVTFSKSVDVIKKLLEYGADVNKQDNDGDTALICAFNQSYDIIEALLGAGANVNIKNKKGQTIFLLACAKNKSIDVLKTLIKYGADINIKDSLGNTALFLACNNKQSIEIIKLLIDNGSDINNKNSNGITPLMAAIASKQPTDVIKILINAGADINIKDKENRNASYYCSITSNYEYIKYFIQKHFNILVNKYEQTCFFDDYGLRNNKSWFSELEYFIKNVMLFEYWERETKNTQKEIIEKTNEIFLDLLRKRKTIKNIQNKNQIKTGIDFEQYIKDILEQTGFNVKITSPTGDQGVDLIATLHGTTYAIQCKYYSRPVGNKAVQEVIAGKGYYKCDIGCVVTNNTYTESARKLAYSQNIHLLNTNNICEVLLGKSGNDE